MKILIFKNRFPIFVCKVYKMNKVFIFAAFVLTMASCQKEVIVPQQETAGMELRDEATTPTSVVPPTVTTTTTTSPTDPTVPTEDPGDITDPMRKKDKKDS
jgi:hypothetical protein